MCCSTLLMDLLDSLGSRCCSAYAAAGNKGEAMMEKRREASKHKQQTPRYLHTLTRTGFSCTRARQRTVKRAACLSLSVMQIPSSPLIKHLLMDKGQA